MIVTYRYGMRYRPPMMGGLPHGLRFTWDREANDASKNIRHGIITTERRLTDDEVYQFELVDLNYPEIPAGI